MSEPANLFGDEQPAGTPEGGAPPEGSQPSGDPTPPAAPPVDMAAVVQAAVAAAVEPLSTRLAALEGRGAQPTTPAQPTPSAAPADPQAAFNELYANPGAFVEQRANAAATAAVDRLASQLTPFFNTIAAQLADRGVEAARESMDASMGEGAYDKLVGNDLAVALAQLPPGQRADANYVRALAAGVIGGKMLDPAGQKEIREVMAAARQRPAAPVVLTGASAQPPRDRLTENERDMIARVRRSGIAIDEKSFLESRNRPRTEEAFGATWMNPSAPARRTN